MPGQVLTGAPPPPPTSGFFGKLPGSGDFVARGLPDGFRHIWDRWVTRHLAPRQRLGGPWPAGGLRFRLVSGGRVAAGVVIPSQDSVERSYPLSLVLIGDDLPSPIELDAWCDAAVRAVIPGRTPDELWDALEDLAVPTGTGPDDPLILWSGTQSEAADPDDPSPALDRLFAPTGVSSRRSSTP